MAAEIVEGRVDGSAGEDGPGLDAEALRALESCSAISPTVPSRRNGDSRASSRRRSAVPHSARSAWHEVRRSVVTETSCDEGLELERLGPVSLEACEPSRADRELLRAEVGEGGGGRHATAGGEAGEPEHIRVASRRNLHLPRPASHEDRNPVGGLGRDDDVR